MRTIIATLTALALCVMGVTANAAPPLCEFISGQTWFASGATVNVYYTSQHTVFNGTVYVTPMLATGLSEAQIADGLQRAIAIWNEEGGSSIRLKYAGPTTNHIIGQSVVVVGNDFDCQEGLARATPRTSAVNGSYLNGTVEFYSVNAGTASCTQQLDWCLSEGVATCIDFVGVMIHEIGHVVFNMAHTDKYAGPNCLMLQDDDSVVQGDNIWFSFPRTIKPYDKEIVQLRYGPRSMASVLRRSSNTLGLYWTQHSVSSTTAARPLYRPGSMPSSLSATYVGWILGQATASMEGGGSIYSASYVSTLQNVFNTGGSARHGKPIALAGYSDVTGDHLIMAYHKEASPSPALYDNMPSRICYRYSTNGGSWFGAETCTNVTSSHHGITASYDDGTNSFLVGYVDHRVDNSSFAPRIGIITIPASDNTTTPIKGNVVDDLTQYAPSMACGAGSCVAVYVGGGGTIQVRALSVNASTGVVTPGSGYSTSAISHDSPSIVYRDSDGYYLISGIKNGNLVTIYRYAGSSFLGIGLAYNNSSGYISTPVLTYNNGTTNAWFASYQ
jgi:hypothetical protein